MTPGIQALDHVQLALPAGGEERARAFYADVLGMTEVPKPVALAARGGCWFAARLEAAGHPVTWDDAVPGVRRFHTADPFGNRLEFLEPGAADPGGGRRRPRAATPRPPVRDGPPRGVRARRGRRPA